MKDLRSRKPGVFYIVMKKSNGNIRKLYAFSFLQKTLFPMAIITLFWKENIGLSLTQILLLQSIFPLQR